MFLDFKIVINNSLVRLVLIPVHIMSQLFNFLIRLIQYHYIFYGLTYVYIDNSKRIVKFSIYLKIYVYIINIIYAVLAIHDLFSVILVAKYNLNGDEIYTYCDTILYIIRLSIFAQLFLLRIREEISLKKWLKIFSPIQNTFFSRISQELSNDKFTQRLQIFNMLIILLESVYALCMFLVYLIDENWKMLMTFCIYGFFAIMENYIMIRHSFILCYIRSCYAKLNNQLKNEQIEKSIANVYNNLDLVIQEVNVLNGPVIFAVIMCQLVQMSLNIYNIFEIIINFDPFLLLDLTILIEPSIFIILVINISVYFLLCDGVNRIVRETGEILKTYVTKSENEQVNIVISLIP